MRSLPLTAGLPGTAPVQQPDSWNFWHPDGHFWLIGILIALMLILIIMGGVGWFYAYRKIRQLRQLRLTMQYLNQALEERGQPQTAALPQNAERCRRLAENLSIAGVSQGISERTRLEAEYTQAEQTIRQQQALLRTVIDTDPNLIFLKDADGRYLLANRAMADYYRTTVEHLVGKTDVDFHPITENVQRFMEENRRILHTQQGMVIPREQVRLADGQEKWLRWYKEPLQLPDRNIPCVLGIGVDITDAVLTELSLRQTEANLRDQIEFDQLLARLSSQFINLDLKQIDQGIRQALQEIGSFTDVEQSYVCRFSETDANFSMTHEWVADGVVPILPITQNLPCTAFPWGLAQIQRGEVVHVLSLEELPTEAAVDRQGWASLNLQSLLGVPLRSQNTVLGWLGFASFHTPNRWGERSIRLLTLFSEMMTNVLLRQQTEAALRQSEERLRLALEAVKMGVWEVDLRTGRQHWSAQSQAIFGFTPGSFSGSTEDFFSRVHPDDRTDVWQARQRALETGIYRAEYRIVLPDQSIHWLSNCGTVFYDDAGQPIRFLGIDLDISDRKQAEVDLRNKNAEMQAIFEAIPDLLFRLSADGIILDYKAQSTLDLFLLPELFLGQSIQSVMPDRLGEQILRLLGEALATGKPTQLEYELPMPTGLKSYEARLVPLGQDLVVAIVRNISERVRLDAERQRAEQQIQQLNAALEAHNQTLETLVEQRTAELRDRSQQLEATNQELESFSYSVSHDLRAPLRAIDGFARLLQEDYAAQLDAEASRYLGIIRTSAKQMGNLIDDLLRLSRLGRQPLRKQIVSQTDLVQEVLESLQPDMAQRQIEIVVRKLPPVYADLSLLKQVWVNLLSNAIKYTSKKPSAHLEIGCQIREGERVYFVRDDGVGFDMRYADKLFGVFQRLHPPADYEGTGVGLALVQRIIHRHGGRVWAQASVNQGATFYFTLPDQMHT